MSLSERKQELKRRRHRKKKLKVFARKLAKATVSEKTVIAEKIRRLTPGCEVLDRQLGLGKEAVNVSPLSLWRGAGDEGYLASLSR